MDEQHQWRLHRLFLWIDDNFSWLKISTWNDILEVSNWLIVWKNKESSWSLITIWWWELNEIKDAHNSWIGWWSWNTINDAENSAIWWWIKNVARGDNSVVVWGDTNIAQNGWVVAWWRNNTANNGLVLWWRKNTAGKTSLVMWLDAQWLELSFAWNGKALTWTARINASGGVLIWTFDPIDGVSLVVNWPVKLGSWWNSIVTWKVEINNTWCIRSYDGTNRQVLGRQSSNSTWCKVQTNTCKFGDVELQPWDGAIGYVNPNAKDCESTGNKKTIICGVDNFNTYYPNCYNRSSNPVYGG